MEQKEIREWNEIRYGAEEGAEIIKELNDRTKSDIDGYNSIAELGAKVKAIYLSSGNGETKPYGYDWIKGQGNGDDENLEVGDELKRIGTLFPGYWVHLYIKSLPIDGDNPLNNVNVISQTSTT